MSTVVRHAIVRHAVDAGHSNRKLMEWSVTVDWMRESLTGRLGNSTVEEGVSDMIRERERESGKVSRAHRILSCGRGECKQFLK